MPTSNIERLQDVADGFEELNEAVTYVGGAVTGLYATEQAMAEPRPTKDVDVVVEFFSFQEKEEFEAMLRRKQFREDTEGGVICRWIYQGIEVDIMPSDERYFQFTNKWYTPGIACREPYQLPNGRTIYIMSPLFFVATKLEALLDRGGEDLRGSSDFEDVVYILNSCTDFMKRFKEETNIHLKEFVKEQFSAFLQRPNLMEEIECAIPYGEEERSDLILQILKHIVQDK